MHGNFEGYFSIENTRKTSNLIKYMNWLKYPLKLTGSFETFSWLSKMMHLPRLYEILKHLDRKLILMLQEKLQLKQSQSNILAIKADWVIWSLFLAVQNGAFTATLREIFPFFASWFVNEVGQAISICTTKRQSAHCTHW